MKFAYIANLARKIRGSEFYAVPHGKIGRFFREGTIAVNREFSRFSRYFRERNREFSRSRKFTISRVFAKNREFSRFLSRKFAIFKIRGREIFATAKIRVPIIIIFVYLSFSFFFKGQF